MPHIEVFEQELGWGYRVYTDDLQFNIEQAFTPGVGNKVPMTQEQAQAFAEADAQLIQAQLDAQAQMAAAAEEVTQ